MTKGSRKMNARIKKALAVRQANRQAAEEKRLRQKEYEERERRRKYINKLKQRRTDLERSKGQLISEAEVSWTGGDMSYRAEPEFPR